MISLAQSKLSPARSSHRWWRVVPLSTMIVACTLVCGCQALPEVLAPFPNTESAEDNTIREAAIADSSFPAAGQPVPKK